MTPSISVIIPTFNRAPILRNCLEALAVQTVGSDSVEILVVDDGSTDQTQATVEGMRHGAGSVIRYLRQDNQGASAARNRALDIAAGRILLIINDDSICEPGVLAEHLRMHDRYPETHEAILGALRISPDFPKTLFNDLHHDWGYDGLPAGTDLGWNGFLTYNISLKAALLEPGERFNEGMRWHEDKELGYRLHRRGLRVRYAPAAVADHYHPMNEASWMHIAERDGRSLALWLRAEPELRSAVKSLGIHSRVLGTRNPRHIASDLVITSSTMPYFIGIARWLAPRQPKLAKAVYRKLFQHKKRRAIDAALEAPT